MVKRLLLLNGLATVLAVLHHSTHWVLIGLFWWTDRYRLVTVPNYDQRGSLGYYGVQMLDQLTVVAVPIFLFVSGFFIAIATGDKEKTVSWKVIFNRIKKLLPPYFLWSVIMIVANQLQGQTYSLQGLIKVLLTGGAVAPFYYIPLLIQLLLLSFLLVPLSRDRAKLTLIGSFLLQIPVILATYFTLLTPGPAKHSLLLSVFRDWHVPGYICWFVLGLVARLHHSETQRFLERNFRQLVVVTVITFVAGMVEWEIIRLSSGREWIAPQITLMFKIFTLCLLLILLTGQRIRLPFEAKLNYIGLRSYGVYLTHVLVLVLASKMIYHLLPTLMAFPFIFELLLVCIGVSLPLILMEMLNRTPLRRFYQYIFG